MLRALADRLDKWVVDENVVATVEGLPFRRGCTIRVLGHAALLEAQVPWRVVATRDVAVRADYDDGVRQELERLLLSVGRELDPAAQAIWMPRETRYLNFFSGRAVSLELAEPEAVLVSKALKAPIENGPLLTEYLASGPSERFLSLASRYKLDLEQFA